MVTTVKVTLVYFSVVMTTINDNFIDHIAVSIVGNLLDVMFLTFVFVPIGYAIARIIAHLALERLRIRMDD